MSRMTATDDTMLSLDRVTVKFGGITALDEVSFDVNPASICGLIGPNGAGKTTCFNCISGLYRPQGGSIRFGGRELTELPRHQIAHLGIGRTFQNLALFPSMSVKRNVMVGSHGSEGAGFIKSMLGLRSVRRSEEEAGERTERILERFGLADIADTPVSSLPFPIQKRVEMARAMASRPRVLILDEPAAGLNHVEVERLAGEIQQIRDGDGITVLLVEHHMNLVMRVSDKVVVLNFGKKIADGLPGEVRGNADVIHAYLGTEA